MTSNIKAHLSLIRNDATVKEMMLRQKEMMHEMMQGPNEAIQFFKHEMTHENDAQKIRRMTKKSASGLGFIFSKTNLVTVGSRLSLSWFTM